MTSSLTIHKDDAFIPLSSIDPIDDWIEIGYDPGIFEISLTKVFGIKIKKKNNKKIRTNIIGDLSICDRPPNNTRKKLQFFILTLEISIKSLYCTRKLCVYV